ncbi:MAG: cobyrinate a,c-diamide synthase [Desulfobacterales bacterium]
MPMSERDFPGIVVAALRGGSGKTILSIGLTAALSRRGRSIAPFKKGPDYIDAGWLALAAGRPCYNLDTFLIEPRRIIDSFRRHAGSCDLSVIEGNRGLYDCIDTRGETSTAELSKLLGLPVVLVIDGTKTTRTMAAVVSGCSLFDPEVRIRGVVLNRVAGSRHENILTRSIEEHCGIPVVGAIPRLRTQSFPERHMGLVPTAEHDWAKAAIDTAVQVTEDHLDLEKLLDLACETTPMAWSGVKTASRAGDSPRSSEAVIGIIQDSAFQFYYPENLEALEAAGARIRRLSPLNSEAVPDDIDGMYIGGGFPETHAQALAGNLAFRSRIKSLAEDGMPIYAECGGLMYLGEKLVLESGSYDMAGVLPVVFGFSGRPQGHGYTILRVVRDNPYFQAGLEIKGHEFHYSKVLEFNGSPSDFAYEMIRGTGLYQGKDGLCSGNVLATYTHLHALGTPEWAPALVGKAVEYRQMKRRESA